MVATEAERILNELATWILEQEYGSRATHVPIEQINARLGRFRIRPDRATMSRHVESNRERT